MLACMQVNSETGLCHKDRSLPGHGLSCCGGSPPGCLVWCAATCSAAAHVNLSPPANYHIEVPFWVQVMAQWTQLLCVRPPRQTAAGVAACLFFVTAVSIQGLQRCPTGLPQSDVPATQCGDHDHRLRGRHPGKYTAAAGPQVRSGGCLPVHARGQSASATHMANCMQRMMARPEEA